MNEDVKAWMEGYKINLVNQITILQNRISLVNAMLLEFDAGTVTPAPDATALFKPKPESRRGRHVKKPTSKVSTTDLVTMALKDAAPDGLTGREIAAVTATPIGTASSRASIMARDGMVRYEADSHRYFALHSTREDNNSDNGMSL